MGYMYILECCDGSYYTGSTKNLEKRLWEHQNMLGANHTIKRQPVKLVYFEEFDRIDEAFYREKQVQGWSRKKKSALITKNHINLKRFSECQNETHCGFDTSTGSVSGAQPPLNRSLSGVEGNAMIHVNPVP